MSATHHSAEAENANDDLCRRSFVHRWLHDASAIPNGNGYTCLIGGDGTPLCADQNAMEWLKATAARTAPPNKIGFIYMLAGDTGTTNHDPHQRETRLHWVQTGPHVMIVGPGVREMVGYPRSLDVSDARQPYVMFPGTPYEHLMLPTQ